MAQITENEIKTIVEKVIGAMQSGSTPKATWDSTQYNGRKLIGVYSDMNEAIDAANKGYKAVRDMSVEKREKIIAEIRRLTIAEAPIMAEIGVAETGMGRSANSSGLTQRRVPSVLVRSRSSFSRAKK